MNSRNKNRHRPQVNYDRLEPRQLLAADVFVTEFMASNNGSVLDGNGNSSDWIELHNGGDQSVNLLGYSLSDDPSNPSKFILPTRILNAGSYVTIFASGDNAPDPDGAIHTNFKLSASGDYLGFYDPEGNLLNEFGSTTADFPEQVTDVSFGLDFQSGEYVPGSQRYFLNPSPGSVNTPANGDLAPLVSGLEKPTAAAIDGQDIIVTAKPVSLGLSISSVVMRARVNYGSEIQLTMSDNGLGNDAIAGDGVYTSAISSSLFDPGDMVRWRVIATAANGATGKAPTFLSSTKSPEYVGTVVADPDIDTDLPVIQWFTNNLNGANGSGTRGSVFYNGEFYDNIFMRRRGQSSNNSPKKNLKFDFNPGDRFLLEPGMKRVDEINLNNTYYDQADVRQTLATETFAAIGQPSPISFPIHTRLNGEFYSLAIYIEQVDADFLDRTGLDPNGALYKADGGSVGNNGFNEAFGLTGFLKRTRLDEGNDALRELAYAVDPNLPQEVRAQYLYDNVDIFSVINYLAGTSLIHNADHLGKNHYVYQDTEGTGKWSFIPWDLDLTFGKNGANTPDTEVYDADVTDQSSNRYPNSHPLFGSSEYTRFSNSDLYNRLIDAVYDTPELRDMYLRRLRSAMDIALQAPGTPFGELKFETRLLELLADIQADWDRDDARWIEAPQTNLSRGTDWGEDLPLATHITRIIDRYLEPRRNHLYNTHNIANAVEAGPEQRLFQTSDPVKHIVPTSEISGWQSLGFNDSAWSTGDQGVGYERGNGYQSLIGTDVESSVFNQGRSVYTRATFNIGSQADLDAINTLLLEIRYDDGFIAYINGVEGARSATVSGSGFSATTGSQEAGNLVPFTLSAAAVSALVVGNNTIAVQVINSTLASSDLLLQYALTGLSGEPGNDIAGIPNEQVGNPSISIDTSDFDSSPISGNQSQEYLRLNNPNSTAVDLSGWRLTGGIELRFRPGTVIPANGELFAVADVKSFLSRSTGPTGGQSLLTHGNYQGQLSAAGETVRLIAADGQLMDTFTVPATQGTDLQSFLRVTEINYNPGTTSGSEEFIEFTNISSGGESTTLDLSGARITDGPSAAYVFPDGTTLAPGERKLVVKDVGAFWTKYPNVENSKIIGQFAGSLSNSGERIRVEDSGGNTVFDIDYGDDNPWPASTDGSGTTLTLIDETGTSPERVGKYYSWRASIANGGTPGSAPLSENGIVINEVLANTDGEQLDFIELFNSGSAAIDIGGWFLSDSDENPTKYQIPLNTIVAAGDHFIFDENDFNPTPSNPDANDFALSGSSGDQVFLTQVVSGVVTRFEDVVDFGASFDGESLGRQGNGSVRLSRLSSNSPDAENTAFKTGPLVLSEVQYHPADPSPAAVTELATVSKSDLEFIEITNPTAISINLANWRLRGDVDFDFATEVLAAGESIVIVSFDPDLAGNQSLVNSFEAQYGITDANFVGPFSGNLSNSFGRVSLQQPDSPPADDPTLTPRVVVDEVVYDDLTPWPDADGSGSSLNRRVANSYGNLSSNWQATTPSPGTATLELGAPQVVETLRDNGNIVRPDLWSTLEIVFDQDVVIAAESLSLINDSSGGTSVDLTGATFSYSSASFTATWDLSQLALDPAFYSYVLSANLITGANGGQNLDGNSDGTAGDNYTEGQYLAIPGDADLDGDVDILGDGFTLVQNLGASSGAAWSNGDFDADGDVDIVDSAPSIGDAFIFVSNIGRNVVPPASALAGFKGVSEIHFESSDLSGTPTSLNAEPVSGNLESTTQPIPVSMTNLSQSKAWSRETAEIPLSSRSLLPATPTAQLDGSVEVQRTDAPIGQSDLDREQTMSIDEFFGERDLVANFFG